ncbi:hypothetical protein D3C72_1517520 [compost metagenome]
MRNCFISSSSNTSAVSRVGISRWCVWRTSSKYALKLLRVDFGSTKPLNLSAPGMASTRASTSRLRTRTKRKVSESSHMFCSASDRLNSA